jgi:hypothetical protein
LTSEQEARMRSDPFLRTAVQVGYKYNLPKEFVFVMKNVLSYYKYETEDELMWKAEELVKEFISRKPLGQVYSMPSVQ